MSETFDKKELEFLSSLLTPEKNSGKTGEIAKPTIIELKEKLGDDWKRKFTIAGVMVSPTDNYLVKEEDRNDPKTEVQINRQQLAKYLDNKEITGGNVR